MLAPGLNGLVMNDNLSVTWLPDGPFGEAPRHGDRLENVVIDPVKTREVVQTRRRWQTTPAGGGRRSWSWRPRRSRRQW